MWRRCSNANDDDAVMDKANLSCSMAAEATITSSSSSCCCPAFSWRWESQWNHHYPPPRRDDEEHHHANLIESVFLSLTSGAIVASSIGGDYARLLSKLAEHVRTSSSDFTIGLTMQCHHAWWGLLRTLKSSWEECNHVASLEPHSLKLAIRSLRLLLARHPSVSSFLSLEVRSKTPASNILRRPWRSDCGCGLERLRSDWYRFYWSLFDQSGQ